MKRSVLSMVARCSVRLAVAVVAVSSFAQAKKEVTFAHQDMVFPYRTVMESGELEKATGYKINWRMFGGGGDVIKAMASGDVMNMRPPEIAAAWERGDIDAAFIWDPVMSKIRRNGKAVATSGDVGKLGYPTFDGLVVNAKWAAEHKGFIVALIKAIAKADADYRTNAAKWTVGSPQVKAVAKWTKADEKDVPEAMAQFIFPDYAAQASASWLGGGAAKTLANTSAFLKEQGRLQEVKQDYNSVVDTSYLKEAMK